MAENESLDIRISRRWAAFLKALYGREDVGLASERFLRTLISGWKKAKQQLLKHGTSLEAVLDRAIDMGDLETLYRQTKRHDYVRLFDIERQPFDTAESLMERAVSASAERVLDQIRHTVMGSELCPDVGTWDAYRRQLIEPVADRIADFARSLASNPAARIRLPVTAPADRPLRPASSFIHLSLLDAAAPAPAGAHA